ncbi:MAG: protein kinase [Gemmatimonadota bacterium]
MPRLGLTLKIFGATGAVVAVVLGGFLLLASTRATRTADAALRRALTASREAARLFIEAERAKLASGANAAAQVPTFIAAVVSGDAGSVLDQAGQYREILGADYTLITDRDAVLRARTDRPGATGDTLGGPLLGGALSGEQTMGVVVQADERLYLVVATPLKDLGSGVVLGALLAARQVTDTLAAEVKRATGSDVVFFLLTEAGAPVVVGSTVPRSPELTGVVAGALQAGGTGASDDRPAEVLWNGERLVGYTAPLANAGGAPLGGFLVLRSRDAELAGFRQLQQTLLLAMLVGLGLALGAAALVARQIGGPVRALVELTRRVADGDYDAQVEVRSRDEIGELATAFHRMVEELKAKQQLVEYLSAPTSGATQPMYTAAGGVASATAVHAIQASGGALQPGEVFSGRYEIKGVLGMGGMGVVYRAWDRELKEPVAIKTLLGEAMQAEPSALERFKQEIKLARKIAHRNVVRTYDLGEVGGLYFITMEFVEGQSLKHLIQQRGSLPVPVVLTVGKQLSRALEVAHEQGVIHRDIKPQNLIVEPSGTLKVMDFGIARLATRTEGMTQAGMAIGTPEYMAPEQLLGEDVDFRADLYAAGAVLFECLTGRPPFVADSPITLVAKQLEEQPQAPASLNAEVPAALSDLVLRMLSKDRAQRPSSAAELHDLLDGVTV